MSAMPWWRVTWQWVTLDGDLDDPGSGGNVTVQAEDQREAAEMVKAARGERAFITLVEPARPPRRRGLR